MGVAVGAAVPVAANSISPRPPPSTKPLNTAPFSTTSNLLPTLLPICTATAPAPVEVLATVPKLISVVSPSWWTPP